MSKTYKDQPIRVQYPNEFKYVRVVREEPRIRYNPETESLEIVRSIHTSLPWMTPAGAATKKRKEIDNEYHWMSTPSWWNRIKNNVPQRRKGRAYEHRVLFLEDLEEADFPSVSKRPHVYYW